MGKEEKEYNPLDKRALAESVAKALLEQVVGPLPPPETFKGAGVYAIYYTGDHPIYRPLTEWNLKGKFTVPIYVGKAVPPGARKGGYGLGAKAGPVLCKRLAEHAKTIGFASNLKLADFHCRYLVVDDIWIPLGESLLIEMFKPVWNRCLDGFGIHDPGTGRHKGQRSAWDVVHPGRPWIEKVQPHAQSKDDLEQKVRAYLTTTLRSS